MLSGEIMFGKSLNRQAVILAGGKGTRLKALLGELPKPMMPIGGKPLLEHQIELARQHGFTDVLVLAGHRAEAIEAYCGDGSRWGVRLRCQLEAQPLGTAGAVAAAFDKLAAQFLVLYGDEMVNVDLRRLWDTHIEARAEATLLLHPNDHPLDSDLVEVNAAGWITAFHNRPYPPGCYFQNLVNAALYVLSKPALAPWAQQPRMLDFGKDLFPAMLRRGARLLGYRSPEYIKDIGTPERYGLVCAEYAAGVVQRSSLSRPQPAVFLDRDGTLNRETGGVTAPDQLELLPGVAAAIQQLNHHGLRVVVITNQPLVAKGLCTEVDLQLIHNKLETLLGREGAFLDRIYYCPHHPEKGFPGERPELKIACACRKPKPGLIYQAARELNLDLRASWLIGDSTADVETARNAGLRSILVRTGHAGQDGKFKAEPDFIFGALSEAAQFIVGAAANGKTMLRSR
jgi:histidinol-phosphate phosphatase family protein